VTFVIWGYEKRRTRGWSASQWAQAGYRTERLQCNNFAF